MAHFMKPSGQKLPDESACFKLHGLDLAVSYAVTNLDVAGETLLTGRELMEHGLPISLSTRPAAVVLVYQRK